MDLKAHTLTKLLVYDQERRPSKHHLLYKYHPPKPNAEKSHTMYSLTHICTFTQGNLFKINISNKDKYQAPPR